MAIPARRNREIAPSGVVGMLIFIVTEVMLFAGFLSAFTITRSNALMGMWPPPGQPRLPVENTMVNTGALLLSGLVLVIGHWRLKKNLTNVRGPLIAALILGSTFVALQGVEWVALLRQGLTMMSSPHGSFFYLIVGVHGLHALAAIIAVGWALSRSLRGKLKASEFYTVETFWYFVVLMWPIIYTRVYF